MSLSFALVTPSFEPDFLRCKMLAESVLRHAAEHVHHYIVVDERDRKLFSTLRTRRTHIVVKQDILPGWLYQVPMSKKWWFSVSRRRPVRGWIVQQIVKLSVDAVCSEDIVLFADSDTFLTRPFEPRTWIRGDQVPLFRETLPTDTDPHNNQWHQVAAARLGITVEAKNATNYVTQLVTWRRDNVIELHRHLERISGRQWAESLYDSSTLSEYVLYGVFVERVLKERSKQYADSTITTLNYWDTKKLDDEALRGLREKMKPDQFGVMVSAKSNTSVEAIRRVFGP
jgi:hypothetical protein